MGQVLVQSSVILCLLDGVAHCEYWAEKRIHTRDVLLER